MIILVDTNANLINLYKDDGIEIYEFAEVDDLIEEIGDNSVLYVTNAIEASGIDIGDLISKLDSHDINADDTGLGLNLLNADMKFLQSSIIGTLIIQDVNIIFNGPGDCKPLDDEMLELIEESITFRSLIQQKKIKIIDYNTMHRESRKQQRKQSKTRKKIDSARDKELDDILIKSSSVGSALKAAENMSSDSDIIETDITDSIINDPTEKMSPEQLDAALKSGKLAP